MAETKIIVVGSSPYIKTDSLLESFERVFPKTPFDFFNHNVDSIVLKQYKNNQEVLFGAYKRMLAVKEPKKNVSYWCGLEIGLVKTIHGFVIVGYVLIASVDGSVTYAQSAEVLIPAVIGILIDQGIGVSDALNDFFGENFLQEGEIISTLTEGFLDQNDYLMQPAMFALLPHQKPDVYCSQELWAEQRIKELFEKSTAGKQFCNTRFVDEGIVITPYSGPEKNNAELLAVLVKKVKEKGYAIMYFPDTTGYDLDIHSWGFLDEGVSNFCPEIYLPIFPQEKMTVKQTIAEIKMTDKEHEYLFCDAIRGAIALLDQDFYKEKDTYTAFFLKNKRRDEENSCEICFGFNHQEKFIIAVYELHESDTYNHVRRGLPLSKKKPVENNTV